MKPTWRVLGPNVRRTVSSFRDFAKALRGPEVGTGAKGSSSPIDLEASLKEPDMEGAATVQSVIHNVCRPHPWKYASV